MPIPLVHLVLLSSIAGALAALSTGCSGTSGTPPNVVIIVMDTARPDYLSVYGHPRPTSPFLESFAERGRRYDRAYSVSSWTLPAHASLFSGALPEVHGAVQTHPKLSADLPLLAEELARAGYQTVGYSPNPWVSRASGLARGFDEFTERFKKKQKGPRTGATHPTVLELRQWFAEKRDPAKPFFLFVNVLEPHMPYIPPWTQAEPFLLTEGAYAAARDAVFPTNDPKPIVRRHYAREAPLSDQEWKALRGLYEGNLLLTDQIVEALVEAVDQHSDPDNTLVFVISDHGENLGEHGHLTHVFNVYDTNLRIVCLARGPGFEPGSVEQRLVQIVDLYPTVMGAAGLAVSPGCVGTDLRGSLSEARSILASLDYPAVSLEAFPEEMHASGVLDPYRRDLRAVVSQRFKLIRGSDGSAELYDILADPEELHPLATDDVTESVLEGLNGLVEVQAHAPRGAPTSSAVPPFDPELLEALRALGYVE